MVVQLKRNVQRYRNTKRYNKMGNCASQVVKLEPQAQGNLCSEVGPGSEATSGGARESH